MLLWTLGCVYLSFLFLNLYLFIFLLKDNCFTELCCFLSNLKVNQPQVYIHISHPSWTSLPSSSLYHPSRFIQSPCLSFLRHTANSYWLSILHMVREVSVTLSIHLTISPISVSIILFSMYVSPLLPCK